MLPYSTEAILQASLWAVGFATRWYIYIPFLLPVSSFSVPLYLRKCQTFHASVERTECIHIGFSRSELPSDSSVWSVWIE